MDTNILQEMEAAGSKLPEIIKVLTENGWENYNHHDNWVKEGVIGEYDTHEAYQEQIGNGKIKRAMDVIIDALIQDEGYRHSWVANIAMAIHDEYYSQVNNKVIGKSEGQMLHEVFNKGAERFLQILTHKPE